MLKPCQFEEHHFSQLFIAEGKELEIAAVATATGAHFKGRGREVMDKAAIFVITGIIKLGKAAPRKMRGATIGARLANEIAILHKYKLKSTLATNQFA